MSIVNFLLVRGSLQGSTLLTPNSLFWLPQGLIEVYRVPMSKHAPANTSLFLWPFLKALCPYNAPSCYVVFWGLGKVPGLAPALGR